MLWIALITADTCCSSGITSRTRLFSPPSFRKPPAFSKAATMRSMIRSVSRRSQADPQPSEAELGVRQAVRLGNLRKENAVCHGQPRWPRPVPGLAGAALGRLFLDRTYTIPRRFATGNSCPSTIRRGMDAPCATPPGRVDPAIASLSTFFGILRSEGRSRRHASQVTTVDPTAQIKHKGGEVKSSSRLTPPRTVPSPCASPGSARGDAGRARPRPGASLRA